MNFPIETDLQILESMRLRVMFGLLISSIVSWTMEDTWSDPEHIRISFEGGTYLEPISGEIEII